MFESKYIVSRFGKNDLDLNNNVPFLLDIKVIIIKSKEQTLMDRYVFFN